MGASDPFTTLGLGPDATSEEIRAARRRLAKANHPDQGGDQVAMQRINEAADAALLTVDAGDPVGMAPGTVEPEPSPHVTDRRQTSSGRLSGMAHDTPSFTVEALPVETFEAMLVVASWLGEVLDDDPPYRLETYLYEPFDCWCRLDVVPDAGASTVSLTVAGIDGAPTPDVVAVRDAWVSNLNAVDWP
jgi:hypothetical protein